MAGIVGTLAAAVIAFAGLAFAGYAAPNWLVLVTTLAFSKGLVALGIVALMRGGLVSFGQGTFYCAGAYAAGMAMRSLGIGDAAVLVALGAIAGCQLRAVSLYQSRDRRRRGALPYSFRFGTRASVARRARQ